MRFCLGGDPSSSISWWPLPPSSLYCKPCAGRSHCLGGAPLTPSGSGAPPLYLSCMLCMRCAHCRSGWFPVSSSPWLRTGVARCLVGVAPSLLCARTRCMRCSSGGSPYSSPPWLHAGGGLLPGWSGTHCSPAHKRFSCAAGWGVTPPPPLHGCALGARASMSRGPPLTPGCVQ